MLDEMLEASGDSVSLVLALEVRHSPPTLRQDRTLRRPDLPRSAHAAPRPNSAGSRPATLRWSSAVLRRGPRCAMP
jgi:hypothetical protein